MLYVENALIWETHALVKVQLRLEWRHLFRHIQFINDCKPYFCVLKVKSAKKTKKLFLKNVFLYFILHNVLETMMIIKKNEWGKKQNRTKTYEMGHWECL